MPKQKTASLNGYGVTEVTPYPLKTQGFHLFLFYCFATTRPKALRGFIRITRMLYARENARFVVARSPPVRRKVSVSASYSI